MTEKINVLVNFTILKTDTEEEFRMHKILKAIKITEEQGKCAGPSTQEDLINRVIKDYFIDFYGTDEDNNYYGKFMQYGVYNYEDYDTVIKQTSHKIISDEHYEILLDLEIC